MIIHPSKSHVVQVRGAQIVPSKAFPANLTLRFPRLIKLRSHEKGVNEAMTKSELEEYFNRLPGDDKLQLNEVRKKKPKISHGSSVISTLVPSLPIESHIFENIEFCIMLKSSESKRNCEEKVIRNGGKIAQIPSSDKTNLIIADELSKIGCD